MPIKLTNSTIIFIFILLLSTLLRFLYIYNTQFPPLEGDAKFYDIMTKQFLQNGILGYNSETPNAYVPPGFPLFLAGIYYFCNNSVFSVQFVQSVLSVLTVILYYKIANLYLRPFFSLLVALIIAVYPSFIYANALLLTEVLFTFLFALFLYLFITGFEKGSAALCCAGIVFGLSILVRPTPAYIIILFLVYYLIFYNKKGAKFLLKRAAIFAIPVILTMLPWWIRNFMLYKQFILFSTSGSNPFLWGVHPYFTGVLETFDKIYKLNPPEMLRDKMWKQEATSYLVNGINSNPRVYANWLLFGKINYYWMKPWVENGNIAHMLEGIRNILHIVIIFFGWIGVLLSSMRDKKRIHVLALIPLYFTLVHVVYLAIPRYAFPVIPIMIIFSVFSLQVLYEWYERKRLV